MEVGDRTCARGEDGLGEAVADDLADVGADLTNGGRHLVDRLADTDEERLRHLLEISRRGVVGCRLAVRVEVLVASW